MTASAAYRHIEETEGRPARLANFPRIRVAQIVMDVVGHGWTADEVCRQHPYLSPAEVHAASAYYYDNKDAIDEEIRAEWQAADTEAAAASPSPFFLRMRAKGLL